MARLPEESVARFEQDGFLVVEELFDHEEVTLLRRAARAELDGDEVLSRKDASGAVTRLEVRNELGADVFSDVVRAPRVVDAVEQLLGGEVYHYHHKLMIKDPRVGGAWEWHQDYGYWYRNGCLLPLMASCMVAIDAADRANGCLQVLRGSQAMGRVEHVKLGDQTAADPERVAVACQRFEQVQCELAAGSALLFHCNLLHRSARNESERSRLSLICCYNAARNDPYKEHHHPRYTPLAKGADERLVRGAHG